METKIFFKGALGSTVGDSFLSCLTLSLCPFLIISPVAVSIIVHTLMLSFQNNFYFMPMFRLLVSD